MMLLHHWSTVTYSTFETGGVRGTSRLFQTFIPNLDFEHSFVLPGVCSVAALNLAALNSTATESHDLLLQASAHQAVQSKSSILHSRTSTRKNCKAVFMFSLLIIIHAFASASLERANEPISSMVNGMSLIRGNGTVLTPYIEVIKSTELGILVAGERTRRFNDQITEFSSLKSFVAANANQYDGATVNALMEAIEGLHFAALDVEWSKTELEWPFLSTI
jgi:hypothetical protein